MSLSTTMPTSHATSPIDDAVEKLWHDGVIVVASPWHPRLGQDAVWYAPATIRS
jgi:hypothetical protein